MSSDESSRKERVAIVQKAVDALCAKAVHAMKTNFYGKVRVEVAFQNGVPDRFTTTEKRTER